MSSFSALEPPKGFHKLHPCLGSYQQDANLLYYTRAYEFLLFKKVGTPSLLLSSIQLPHIKPQALFFLNSKISKQVALLLLFIAEQHQMES